ARPRRSEAESPSPSSAGEQDRPASAAPTVRGQGLREGQRAALRRSSRERCDNPSARQAGLLSGPNGLLAPSAPISTFTFFSRSPRSTVPLAVPYTPRPASPRAGTKPDRPWFMGRSSDQRFGA